MGKKSEKKYSDYPQYTYFGIMLYPYENDRDSFILNYILSNRGLFPKVVYIDHDRDIELEDRTDEHGIVHHKGDIKKCHTHVVFKWHKNSNASTIMKHFRGDINKVEEIEDYISQIHYLLHITYAARKAGKPEYDICELKGDKDLISKVFIQNTNSEQFLRVLKVIKNYRSFNEVFEYFENIGDFESIEICMKYGYLLLQMQNQINKNIKENYEIYTLNKRLYINIGD